ncbi:MmpS family transport accessory protein [Nocardia sp. NPDC052254]|uniref:MmpS family transport accessory protein n=1 Tax=Nocardia sp. NPDC052254 TaxID=3155681 RepID=UPI00342368EB
MGYPQQYPPEYGVHPGYPQPYMYPPPRKPVWPWVVGSIAIVVGIAAAIGIVVVVAHKDDKPAVAAPITLVYEVTGDVPTPPDINYVPAQGDGVHMTPESLPWRMEVTMTKSKTADRGFVSAYTGPREITGGVTCRIFRDGKVVVQDTVTGSGTASCVTFFR